MDKPWENDSCESLKAHFSIYSTPKAAALWCGVPEDQIDRVVSEVTQLSETGFGRGVWVHPYIPCVEPRSRAIAEAMENGDLPHGREDGKTLDEHDHAAPERRHFFGRHLKEWMQKSFPNERPAFLFDEAEQGLNTGITTDDYLVLKAKNEALEERLRKAEEWYKNNVAGSGAVSTKGHNSYSGVIRALAESLLESPLSNNYHADAKRLITLVESKGKVMPVGDKTLAKYLSQQ